ncbi:MAG: hypothetical protein NTX64_02395 [Elusimicrobia bacterium]|nr:hypothetical protein [Elusimicrobiota bacterium]
MKRRFLLSCALLLAAVASLPARAALPELHFNNDFNLDYNDIAGPGRAASSLTQGYRYTNQLNANLNGKAGLYDYNFSVGGKATDDKRNDLKVFTLTNLQGRASNGVHSVNLGDTFESFSQYALAASLKGGSYHFAKGGTYLPEATAVFGYAYPRWDNFYGDHVVKVVERQAVGGRLKQKLGPDAWTGASVVRTVDTHRRNSTDPLENATVYTGDWEYHPIPGLTLDGEHSWSNTAESTAQDAETTHFNGNAQRIEAVGDADPSRVSLEFERVSHEYQTLLGAATPDRLKAKAKWRYLATKRITINSGMLWFRDDVDGQKADPTQTWRPELGATVKAIGGRPNAAADFSYRLSRAYGPAMDSADHVFNVGYRDRFADFDSDSNLGYTYYDAARNTKEYTYNTTLGTRRSVGEVVLKPQLAAGGWTSNDELSMVSERIYEFSAGCGVEIPRWKVTADLKLGQNSLDRAGADNTRKFFTDLGVYYRPALPELRRTTIYLRAYTNEFRYTTAARDFRERSVKSGVNIEF